MLLQKHHAKGWVTTATTRGPDLMMFIDFDIKNNDDSTDINVI